MIQMVRMTYIRDYRKYQYSGNSGKKVVLHLLAIVYNGHKGYILCYTFRNGMIDYFEVFRLCTGSLAFCTQAHH